MTIEQINTLSVLNGLIAVCGASHHRFSAAGAELNDPALKALFIALAEQRAGFMQQLRHIADLYGGADDDAADMDVQPARMRRLHGALSAGEKADVLALFVEVETSAAETYERALREEGVIPDATETIRVQLAAVDDVRRRLERMESEEKQAGKSR